MKDKIETRYYSLVESIENICKTKNIRCIISSQTHWTFFKFIRLDGLNIKYEMNWSHFIKAGSNDLIIYEVTHKINELLNAK